MNHNTINYYTTGVFIAQILILRFIITELPCGQDLKLVLLKI